MKQDTGTSSKAISTFSDEKRAAMFKKILTDRKYISEALKKGTSLNELEKQGFKFATLPDIKD